MLDNLVGEDHVKAAVGERQRLGRGQHDAGQAAAACAATAGSTSTPVTRAKAAELLGVHPHAAAGIQDACAVKPGPLPHQRQTPLLPRVPDVRRVAKAGRLIRRALKDYGFVLRHGTPQ